MRDPSRSPPNPAIIGRPIHRLKTAAGQPASLRNPGHLSNLG